MGQVQPENIDFHKEKETQNYIDNISTSDRMPSLPSPPHPNHIEFLHSETSGSMTPRLDLKHTQAAIIRTNEELAGEDEISNNPSRNGFRMEDIFFWCCYGV